MIYLYRIYDLYNLNSDISGNMKKLIILVMLPGLLFPVYSTSMEKIILQNGINGYDGCIDNWAKELETENVIGNGPNHFSYDYTTGIIGNDLITVENYKFRKT